MLDDDATGYPRICGSYGRLSKDGKALLVDATTDGEPVRFSVELDDVQHLVSYLLVWATRLGSTKSEPAAGEEQLFSHPIPVSAVSLCGSDGRDGYLGISVGPAELLFSLPVSAFAQIGQTLLAASAQPRGTGKA